MNFEKILIVDDEVSGRRLLEGYLRSQQFSVTAAGTLAEADLLLKQEFFDLLLVDIGLPDGNGCELLERAARLESPPIALVLSGDGSGESVIASLRAGAFDYLAKPFTLEKLRVAMERAATFRHSIQVRRYLEEAFPCVGEMRGESPGIRHLRSLVARVAGTESPVLIVGERGAGKCRVAGMVHRGSPRAGGPLVRVHCAGVEEAQLENELFGRITETCEEGTGRRIQQGGRLELAQGGTLLLEEISELPMCLQLKLMGVLREGCWERLGGGRRMTLDVRLIATTQRDLTGCVARGTFLQELHHHLNGFPLHVPPLRERIADLPMLVCEWMERPANRRSGSLSGISDEALRHLMAYSWPGNVLELENVLERAAIVSEGTGRIEAEALEGLRNRKNGIGLRDAGEKRSADAPFQSAPHPEPLLTLEEMEKRQVLRALEITNQNRTRAAHLLKISVRTLRNKLHQYRAQDPTLVLTLARNRHLPRVSPVAMATQPANGRM